MAVHVRIARPQAAAGVADVQVADAVTSRLVPSEKIAVATSCCANPAGRRGLNGVTWIVVTVAPLTVSMVVPLTPPEVAVIVTVPVASVVVRPRVAAALLTAATVGSLETQLAVAVRLMDVPSVSRPVKWLLSKWPYGTTPQSS